MTLIHGETKDITVKVQVENEEKLRAALRLHDGINAADMLFALGKQRYGTTIKKIEDVTSGTVKHLVVSDGTADAIDVGRYEAFPTDTCRRFVKSKASLFTSANQTWQLTLGEEEVTEIEGEEGPTEPTPSEIAQDLWQEYREKGQANLKLIRADRLAVLMRVAGMYPTWRSQKIAYDVLAPYVMNFGFADKINDDGTDRPTITTEIEDCTAFVVENVRVGSSADEEEIVHIGEKNSTDRTDDKNKNKRIFTAWVGRTEDFPDGRLLVYKSDQWSKIPSLEDPEKRIIFEDPAGNPLTKWSNENEEFDSIEYPVSLIVGTDAGEAETLLPTEGIGLAETCIEIDLFVSRMMRAIGDAAVGLQVQTTAKEVTHQDPYPNVSSGQWEGSPGQEVDYKTVGAEEAAKALEFMNTLIQLKAENNDIAGHLVTPDATSAPESGIALAIRMMPMIDDRQERSQQAQGAVGRMFEIEKRLTLIHAKEGKRIPIESELSWNAGQLELPESETERIANIKAMEDAGYIDHTEAVKRSHQLNTRKEAQAIEEEQGLEGGPTEASALDGLGLPEVEEEIEEI